MEMKQLDKDNVTVLELSGKIMGGPDATMINEVLHELIDSQKPNVVADLSQVNWMNSTGLGILISGLTTIRNAGGDLKLASPTEKVLDLMTITKLVSIFDIHDSLDKAISSFSN